MTSIFIFIFGDGIASYLVLNYDILSYFLLFFFWEISSAFIFLYD